MSLFVLKNNQIHWTTIFEEMFSVIKILSYIYNLDCGNLESITRFKYYQYLGNSSS